MGSKLFPSLPTLTETNLEGKKENHCNMVPPIPKSWSQSRRIPELTVSKAAQISISTRTDSLTAFQFCSRSSTCVTKTVSVQSQPGTQFRMNLSSVICNCNPTILSTTVSKKWRLVTRRQLIVGSKVKSSEERTHCLLQGGRHHFFQKGWHYHIQPTAWLP